MDGMEAAQRKATRGVAEKSETSFAEKKRKG